MSNQPQIDAAAPLADTTAETARLIVCERTGRWAVALRRELPEGADFVQETRSLAECFEALGGDPAGPVAASFAVIELTAAGVDELLGRMARLQRDFPLARIAVVAPRAMAAYEWLFREAGAVHFTSSPRQLGPLAKAARRHLAGAPVRQQSLAERLWSSLPWKG